METELCAAVGTASDQHTLEARTVYGDRTVCSCMADMRLLKSNNPDLNPYALN